MHLKIDKGDFCDENIHLVDLIIFKYISLKLFGLLKTNISLSISRSRILVTDLTSSDSSDSVSSSSS